MSVQSKFQYNPQDLPIRHKTLGGSHLDLKKNHGGLCKGWKGLCGGHILGADKGLNEKWAGTRLWGDEQSSDL